MAIEIKDLKLAVGKCETCKHVSISQYDPSPVGISLSSGTMTEMECTRETETIPDTVDIDGAGIDYQCPGWEPDFQFCKTHGWFLNESGYCIACENEMYDRMCAERGTSDDY